MRFSEKEIVSTYEKIKRMAVNAVRRGDIDVAIGYIDICARIVYNFNWRYCDDELDGLLAKISSIIIQTPIKYKCKKDKLLFYDAFGFDNKGLTQQYIRALMSWGVEFLYVLEYDDLNNSTRIINELNKYPGAEIFMISTNLSSQEKLKRVYEKVVDYAPEKAFFHIAPWSTVAVMLLNLLGNTTRYLVNLTDHAFWLGANVIDYCLEFRDYGCTVSLEKRGLKTSQLLIQPYYPILDCEPFEGFPAEVTEDKVVIFTGGTFYKMYDKKETFFYLLKSMLDRHPNIVVLIAGSGGDSPIRNFIKVNSFEHRVLLIGNRRDINYVFENCDIYMSTYPITGGLMGQYAAVNSKPILSYTSSDIVCNMGEGFVNWGDTSNWSFTKTDFKSFFEEAYRLISDPLYRKDRGNKFKRHVITSDEFNDSLKELVYSNKSDMIAFRVSIDYDKFTRLYLDTENKYLGNFKLTLLRNFKLRAFFLFPIVALKSLFSQHTIGLILTYRK